SDGRAVEGIVSERDIAYALAAHASRLPTILVAQLMTEAVVSCRYQDSINDVMGVMTQKRIRHLPVKRGNDLAGLISIGDVLKHRLSEMKLEAEVLLDYARAQR
ncbi:MAG: CBS domain-containing protein, partial [Pseudomonadota bacterium]